MSDSKAMKGVKLVVVTAIGAALYGFGGLIGIPVFANTTLKPAMAILALFAGVSRDAVPCREVSQEEALRFLRKQDMDASGFEQGLNMVTRGGLPLGFVKRVGARVNNMYPNSLRILK